MLHTHFYEKLRHLSSENLLLAYGIFRRVFKHSNNRKLRIIYFVFDVGGVLRIVFRAHLQRVQG